MRRCSRRGAPQAQGADGAGGQGGEALDLEHEVLHRRRHHPRRRIPRRARSRLWAASSTRSTSPPPCRTAPDPTLIAATLLSQARSEEHTEVSSGVVQLPIRR
jgi:hypothetical protein